MTNFELIKSMSVESLAKFINMPISCNDICDDFCCGCSYSCKHRNGEGIIYRWLNSEVGGELIMSNKLEATIGDKLVLYKNGLPFKTVTIVQRKLHMNGLQELFVDTLDEDGEYGNTYPLHRTVSELLESYREYWDRDFMILRDEKIRLQFNVGDKVLRKEDNKEYIILYIGHMRDTRRAENEYYLILEDAEHDTNKSTCIYSFDINDDFELVKDDVKNKIELLPNMEFISTSGKVLKCDMNQRNMLEMYNKINEIIDYINKGE